MAKKYIGDGVYADYDSCHKHLIVTTEDGLRVTNTIFLDSATWYSLRSYVERLKQNLNDDVSEDELW